MHRAAVADGVPRGPRGPTSTGGSSHLLGSYVRRLTVRYRVEISPLAWTQLGSVPTDVFREIRSKLEAQTDQPDVPSGPVELTVGRFVAVITVDKVAQKVTLSEVREV